MNRLPERTPPTHDNDDATRAYLLSTLQEAVDHLECGRWQEGIQHQHHGLAEARRMFSTHAWINFAKIDCPLHPLRKFVHQDPFTRRSFEKPRGYAGDAVLIDYIYGIGHRDHELQRATPFGKWFHNYSTNTPAPRAVRRRMYLIAELIDLVCAERRDARILSIASGHMRELLISHAYRAGVLGNAVAFDQDEASLAELSAKAKSRSLRCERGSVSRLIVGRHNFSDFDLVYASGLFDYLEHKAAKRLTETMFSMLRPGGRLLIANFLPGIYDMGYMESFMGWDLIYRDRNQIVSLVAGLDSTERQCSYFEEAERNIGFLLVKKKS
jgi:extracellular factor (EF) 3-hydroxypalmitic acid methyl ester biosynthesis protein